MSTSAISSSAASYLPNNQQNTMQQNFQALVQAIQSGNLSSAQQAYATLTQNSPTPNANGSSNSQSNPFQQAIASIGSALQSGNISGAQTALQSLQQTMKTHHGHHHHGSQAQNPGNNTSPPNIDGHLDNIERDEFSGQHFRLIGQPLNMMQESQRAITPCEGMTANTKITALTSLSLRGRSVTIGPVIPDDTGPLFLWLNDVESANLDLPYRPTDWMTYNNWLTDFGKNPSQVIFAIRRIVEPRIIGFMAFTKIHPVHRSAELGVRIGYEADRGKGHGKDAINLALKYAWNYLNLNRVQLSVFGSNQRAIRAYSAAGFQQEGKLRQAAFIDGQWLDVVLMGVIRP